MSTESFFEETKQQSAVKTAIVSKYFWSWAKVIMAQVRKRADPKIAYLDLFAGPGRYQDGTKSTPLLILEKAIEDDEMSQMLVTIFNDKDDNNVRELHSSISHLPGIERLKHQPLIMNGEVGSEMVKLFSEIKFIPALFFVDPWGYKGLSLQLVNSVLKDWGCDCIFFFNYNRINMGLNNPTVQEHMAALFSEKRAATMREKLESFYSPADRRFPVFFELNRPLDDLEGMLLTEFAGRTLAMKEIYESHHIGRRFIKKNYKDALKQIEAKGLIRCEPSKRPKDTFGEN